MRQTFRSINPARNAKDRLMAYDPEGADQRAMGSMRMIEPFRC